MKHSFAKRMDTVHRSFIREILKMAADPSIISFAGGLPNPDLFPMRRMERAAVKVLGEQGKLALQYSMTEGYPPLREMISERYARQMNLQVDPEDILITAGSQQALDLLSKVLLNEGDNVLMERPGYLGAIQTFSLFMVNFLEVSLEDDGPELNQLHHIFDQNRVKLFYGVPNFQNPSGLTYALHKRQSIADKLKQTDTLFIEDNPYGELRFIGKDIPTMYSLIPEQTVLLGSFSKIAAPGLRLGWMVAQGELMDKLVIAKQAADLHTSSLTQRVMHQFMVDNDIDEHIAVIKDRYGKHRELMVSMIEEYFPENIKFTRPEGGMFLWVTLPEGCSSKDLLAKALEKKVAFVPGVPFYVDGGGQNTLRLNYSNASEENIEIGIRRLGEAISDFIQT